MRKLGIFFLFGICAIANAQQVIEPAFICPIGSIAQCLDWQTDRNASPCNGYYKVPPLTPSPPDNAIEVNADRVLFRASGQSELSGHVIVGESDQQLSASTAYIYKDSHTNAIKKIELFDRVRYQTADHLMVAAEATYFPEEHAGSVRSVLYRFHTNYAHAGLPAWGQADFIRQFSNKDYHLKNATYSTCPPIHPFWQIKANDIKINDATKTGVAKHAWLEIKNTPVLYAPYFSFPTSNERKSGFLIPSSGYSNIGGYELLLPYYWNIAPNYDATFTPHLYTQRGMMLGGETRYIDAQTRSRFDGHFLPHDRAFNSFLKMNETNHPYYKNKSDNRWAVDLFEATKWNSHWNMNVQFRHVSDDYYLQDFSNNLAITTENQLLGQGQVTYTSEKSLLRGTVQGYQTLHPINQPMVSDIYQRLPQLYGAYNENNLPFDTKLDLIGQFDYFQWPSDTFNVPSGPRYHVNPKFSRAFTRSWGYVKPSIELVSQAYEIQGIAPARQSYTYNIPRFAIDSGLYFDRNTTLFHAPYTQTFEPRLFYLNVPFHNQDNIPIYDSANFIFNTDQVFRFNRFSGNDRIGDANQLGYGFTTRFFSNEEDFERANFTVGQIHYFDKRRVDLCYNLYGPCQEGPTQLGYLSNSASLSPLASHATYYFNRVISTNADYVWNPATRTTNNGDLNFRYQPQNDQLFSVGYTYLVNGNLIRNPKGPLDNGPLHQATSAFALPITETWQSLGVYSYNLSEHYSMLGLFGVQYDSCCWAMRLLGGKTFMNINTHTLKPQYNTNFYLQFLFKGLGSISVPDPSHVLQTYLPGVAHEF